uniref:Uncharacterized protein n=1 Tax=Anguilla anguilla TaxID=7936 RepID=A0A0E9WMN7_ANGAN
MRDLIKNNINHKNLTVVWVLDRSVWNTGARSTVTNTHRYLMHLLYFSLLQGPQIVNVRLYFLMRFLSLMYKDPSTFKSNNLFLYFVFPPSTSFKLFLFKLCCFVEYKTKRFLEHIKLVNKKR